MDHMKKYWDQEMEQIRKTVSEPGTILFTDHLMYERMWERHISLVDIAYAFLTGKIYEGYDSGQYPHYRNPDPLRTICGEDSNGEILTVGVALQSNGVVAVTTAYRGVPKRLKHFFE